MNSKFFIVLAVCLYSIEPGSFASDSTLKKGSLSMFINGGLTRNSVYGSMVDRNFQFEGKDVTMKHKTGFMVCAGIEKLLSPVFFLRSGLSLLQKQVDPMENGTSLYRDRLQTAYLVIPLAAGVNMFPPGEKPVNLTVVFGPSANFRLIDKSSSGPDRVGFKTPFVSISLSAGASFSCALDSKTRFVLWYNYVHDITNSYVETLYWSSEEPRKKFVYKYQTSCFSLGFQWPLK